jgi:rhodanese-related sulfurtransferase
MQFVLDNWYLFLALIVVLALLVGPNLMQSMHGIKSLSPAESVLLVNRQSGVFLDVSEPGEYRNGHIPNALNVPASNLNQAGAGLEKYKQRPIIVVARGGHQRALRAAVALRRRGFAEVHVLGGGLAAWEKENLPLER